MKNPHSNLGFNEETKGEECTLAAVQLRKAWSPSRSFLALLSLSLLLPILSPSQATDFAYENLEGQRVSISDWPAFIITSQSETDLKDALRCATRVSSLEHAPHWLIDFAWPQATAVKRRAAKRLLKSSFMKSRSAVLERSRSQDSLIVLIDNDGTVLWSSLSYPIDEDWKTALDILRANRAE